MTVSVGIDHAEVETDNLPLMSVRSVSKHYGQRIGCADVDFDIWPGEVLAIVGESGSGKTTLLNCISTRLAPTARSCVTMMTARPRS